MDQVGIVITGSANAGYDRLQLFHSRQIMPTCRRIAWDTASTGGAGEPQRTGRGASFVGRAPGSHRRTINPKNRDICHLNTR